jgi:hypothetical protein
LCRARFLGYRASEHGRLGPIRQGAGVSLWGLSVGVPFLFWPNYPTGRVASDVFPRHLFTSVEQELLATPDLVRLSALSEMKANPFDFSDGLSGGKTAADLHESNHLPQASAISTGELLTNVSIAGKPQEPAPVVSCGGPKQRSERTKTRTCVMLKRRFRSVVGTLPSEFWSRLHLSQLLVLMKAVPFKHHLDTLRECPSAEHKTEHNNCRMRGPEPDLEARNPTVSP